MFGVYLRNRIAWPRIIERKNYLPYNAVLFNVYYYKYNKRVDELYVFKNRIYLKEIDRNGYFTVALVELE